MKITLCNKDLEGDIPMETFENRDTAYFTVIDWLNTKNFEESVFVCFSIIKDLPINQLRDEHNSILVSHNLDDITDMLERYISYKLDFSIFEFESYSEAFGYCIDLKESF